MCAVRLSSKQLNTLSARSRTSTGASASATGASATVTTSLKQSGAKQGSGLESALLLQIRASGLPCPVAEFRFHDTRRWRADFAWPERRLLVEVEGGHWTGGRHTRGAGFDADCEKYAEASLLGWRVIRVTGTHIKSGQALDWIRRGIE